MKKIVSTIKSNKYLIQLSTCALLLFTSAWTMGLATAGNTVGSFTTYVLPVAPFYPMASGASQDGVITGSYVEESVEKGFVPHGFVVTTRGQLTSFDPDHSTSTTPVSINTHGDVTGHYMDADYAVHGFVRSSRGIITTFDVPAALAFIPSSTKPTAINDSGMVTGSFGAIGGAQGFVRDAKGAVSTFAFDNATTMPIAINSGGDVIGWYLSDGKFRGFLRQQKGNSAPILITIYVPEGVDTFPTVINDKGVIAGYFRDINKATHGFIRDAEGNRTIFVEPEGSKQIYPTTISSTGVITGFFSYTNKGDLTDVMHGFLVDANGVITTFDPPKGRDTWPIGITESGVVVGTFVSEEDGKTYGFTYTPSPN